MSKIRFVPDLTIGSIIQIVLLLGSVIMMWHKLDKDLSNLTNSLSNTNATVLENKRRMDDYDVRIRSLEIKAAEKHL